MPRPKIAVCCRHGDARQFGRRLSTDDWIQAGFALLAEGGPNALRLDRLCERLEVTKGSFYWHFADMRAYRAALVEAWGDLRDQTGAGWKADARSTPASACG